MTTTQPTKVTATRKPCQVISTSTATVEATNATYDEVLDAGLAALRETRRSLWRYGIKHLRRDQAPDQLTGTFIVYADRD